MRVALLHATTAPATPALAANCRKSRRDSITPPDRWQNCGEVSGGLVNHPEADALNQVVESVVIEIDRVDYDAEPLHAGSNQSERYTGDAPGYRPFPPATVRRHKRQKQEQSRRQIAHDRDRKISRRKDHRRGKDGHDRYRGDARQPFGAWLQLATRGGEPCREAAQKNR